MKYSILDGTYMVTTYQFSEEVNKTQVLDTLIMKDNNFIYLVKAKTAKIINCF